MYLFPNCPFKPFEDNIFPLGTNPVDKLTTTNTINTNNCEAITEGGTLSKLSFWDFSSSSFQQQKKSIRQPNELDSYKLSNYESRQGLRLGKCGFRL